MKPYFKSAILSAFQWAVMIGAYCPYKNCDCDIVQIICEKMNLTHMPVLVFNNTGQVFLYMDNNMITSVPAGSLPPNLMEATFLGNPIATIDEAAFIGSATTLTRLAFSGAQFTTIPDAFLHLNALTDLSIANTRIVDWNDSVMKHVGKTLKNLYLEGVGLTTWPNWIQYFNNLAELDISSSKISDIPDNALDSVANSLTTLNIIRSNLSSVPKAISHLNVLQFADLQANQISDITWLPKSKQLSSLTLNNNSIRDVEALSNNLRPYASCLFILDLPGNHLTSIPDLSFMTQTEQLDLSHNHISNATSGNLSRSLFFLDLRHNFLPSIPRVYFNLPMISAVYLAFNAITHIGDSDLPSWIFVADLGSNLITELTDSSFPMQSNLTTLTLNNNPIAQISSNALKGLARLREMNLQGTRLTRLPAALSFLNSLKSLDLTGSMYLVCTCLEKSLEPSRIASNQITISGNCGATTIYDFIVHLSPGCPVYVQ